MTAPHPLTQARHRDVARRRERVHQAIAAMTADAAEISVSAVAARARVHRSFLHRHPDLYAAVLAAANPHEHARRLQRRINDLEARLSDLLGAHTAECSGFGPLDTADTQGEIDDLRRSEEHTSELQSRPHLVCRLLLEK